MGNVEVPKWLKDLPLAPEFRPTDTEFADPIAYISRIEKEASAFGICKIIPPVPRPSKKYVFRNLNRSLTKCPDLGSGADLKSKMGAGDGGDGAEVRAVITTRHQELGQSVKRVKGVGKENPQLGVYKQVWQSGEVYTLEQFESKSKAFARSLLGVIKEVNPLVVEALFWKATSEKPIYIEYANDVPGSAFGEPEGQFRYIHRRRRKRASYQSYRRRDESSEFKKDGMDNASNSIDDEVKCSTDNCPSSISEITPRSPVTYLTSISEESLGESNPKTVNVSDDMEGTAGWKLSNSPWNLQLIARSPGSLTRFMPDDIPGVTSPMVYIGMLFSWFAWHVEDHELHSMNFLHTGSPKTWYAVPGDYAFAFEEVIHTEAYGGNVDRLAALSLLGEKTTLLSPELIVSSSIPCYRLVQNPGEFVITFPRAYHVGFSHGFNCGEAANFGTSHWLQVAKEAAVRRAAMNYLPMLSHQQLLYLLTMSFVSRVPRSLLPGFRSSRLKDRLREERESSVKRAFLEDLLKGNSILNALLQKDSIYRVVTWNPNLLPSASRDAQLPGTSTTDATVAKEDVSHIGSECNSKAIESNLLKEMSLYMETLNDLDLEDDDLSGDFQVDSGALACVACGILGFPFMSVLRPSEEASVELLPGHHVFLQRGAGNKTSETESSPENSHDPTEASISGPSRPSADVALPPCDMAVAKGWNTGSKYFKPHIFCLEHAVQIVELLQSKGGANMLIICHSDYHKIKAHATAIAMEIGSPFDYNEFPLESASREDLNLIELALSDQHQNQSGEDWTSKLGINLQYYVNVRKNSPSKQIQQALALEGLFSYKSPDSNLAKTKWHSRKSRSRSKSTQPANFRPGDNVQTNIDEISEKKSDVIVRKEKLIQYTRKKFRVKVDCSANTGQLCPGKHLPEEVPSYNCGPDKGETSSAKVLRETSTEGVLGTRSPVDATLLLEIPISDAQIGDHPVPAIVEECSNDRTGHSANEDSSTSGNLDTGTHQQSHSSDGVNGDAGLNRTNQNSRLTPEKIVPGHDTSTTQPITDPVHDNSRTEEESCVRESMPHDNEVPTASKARSTAAKNRKRKSGSDHVTEKESCLSSFIRSPCEGLRPRASKDLTKSIIDEEISDEVEPIEKKTTKPKISRKQETREKPHKCDIEGCRMSFETKTDLQLHKRNRCPYEGCGKKFSSHKYAIIHQRVHEDDRPLKCPWKGCTMSFKWAWARTEHIRLHTGERPYKCTVEGCGRSFRFVSDYSRHRRRTGHYANTSA